jgi:hypothetical protein
MIKEKRRLEIQEEENFEVLESEEGMEEPFKKEDSQVL